MGAKGGRIGIFGTGVMAKGITRLCLSNDMEIVLLSATPGRAHAAAQELAEEGSGVSTHPEALAGCGLFLEATVEEYEPKFAALGLAERMLPPEAVLASTTSSLSITELASRMDRPERVIGLHFFNPVHRMPLVEVVAGLRTDPAVVEKGRDFAHALGKRPLRVPDGAGFLVNRLLIPYLNQAVRLTASGYATVEDVDRAMILGADHPMGPFALIDLIGADVCIAIGRSLEEAFHRTCDAPPPELRRRAAVGWLGRKTGRGFHESLARND